MHNIDFFNIDYLQQGNAVQRAVYAVLKETAVLQLLSAYDPVLAGTIPIAVDIPGSDLDILCSFKEQEVFKQDMITLWGEASGFSIKTFEIYDQECVVINFDKAGYPFEIFAQQLPVREQMGYRHMLIEHHLLQQHGEGLRQEVIRLKKEGYKTEPAFCLCLGIDGNPYVELLKLETEQ
ncbi:DUF4269 domain-containing protein [Chitinophaga pinensis]|uniref:DUF4269 domain-containing protein n=1 Tax=Chitinophaga pinensis (strain ATCC 43595 / DSM 2588 / LMG 13176 / NBRC 15968 / NCIMB 11800 / UQM 2034) TaxID=485918 RepID=A0A979G935_CHIPD|nr:DUF4269 domain-containing protein [Chitinophaga pinensis]ACU62968.1 conserved hypothetical protein [Chitinophaga pinensis DSM 2588]